MDIERLYDQRREALKPLWEKCVCVDDSSYKHKCWGCDRCWHCVDKADEHHCIECCHDDFAAVKANWECRTKPSIECLMQIPAGDHSALVIVCHQAEIAYRVRNNSEDRVVMRDAIKYVLIQSGMLYDNDHADKLAEKIRVVLNMLKHDKKTGEKKIDDDYTEAAKESVKIAPRTSIEFLNTIGSSSIVEGEVQPPTERKHRLGLFSIVCQMCKGLDMILLEPPPRAYKDAP